MDMNKTPEEQMDIKNNKVQAVLSYIGILVLIPIFAAKDSKFARFHANQGLVLFIIDIAVGIIGGIMGAIFRVETTILGFGTGVYQTPFWVTGISGLLGLACFVLAILGIVNAANGDEKELPIIGSIKILK